MTMIDLGKTLKMVDDMEIIEKFIGSKGRFVGDMVHIKISDLAKAIKKKEQK